MGIKAFKATVIVTTLLLLPCVQVEAATVSDLYTMYNKELTSMYPKDVLSTIASYQRSLRDEAMYKYVKKSEFDAEISKSRITELEQDLKRISRTLENGYNLSLSDIYQLEDEYSSTLEHLNNVKQSIITSDITLDRPVAPSKEEYEAAVEEKSRIDNSLDIGAIPIKYPVSGVFEVASKTEKHLSLKVDEDEKVSPILNGVVVKVEGNGITISHGNGIYTYYGDVKTPVVKVGDAVYQGQCLGYTSTCVTFKIKINDDILDVSRLFSEG